MALKLPKWLFVLTGVGTVAGGITLLKEHQGDWYRDEKRISGKTVIITGANTGIGKETAHNLANRGARLILACRDMEKCIITRDSIREQTFNKNIHCKEVDLASFQSVRRFADEINKQEKRIDVLINNAAVMCPPKSHTKDGIELQMGVNYFSPFLLTHLLLDKLKTSAPSRIINIISFPSRNAKINFKDLNSAKDYEGKKAYMQSKYALYLFSETLGENLKGSGVSVFSVYPGLVSNTELGRHMGMNKSIISSTILSPLWWIMFRTPIKAIQTIIYCSVEENLDTVPSSFWQDLEPKEYPEELLKKDVMKRLWAISEHWTDLK